jgi:phthalate 4,5-dioxygenase oxygenase subunit
MWMHDVTNHCIGRYHGWQFDKEGAVTKIPSLIPGKKIPANAKVKKYPTHEADGFVWVSD